jgi:hypothetical protein
MKCSYACDVFRLWELADCFSLIQIGLETLGAHDVAHESRCWLGQYHFANVDCDIVIGRSLKKTAHWLDVLLVGCRKNHHVFKDPAAIWDVVKDF